MTIVHIYHEKNYINSYEVDGTTYQDLITNIIKSGGESGQIYTLNGEKVDYNSPITEKEVNYFIPYGIIYQISMISKTLYGPTYTVDFRSNSTYRDIYNSLIAKGVSYPKIFFFEAIKNLDEKMYDPSDILRENRPLKFLEQSYPY